MNMEIKKSIEQSVVEDCIQAISVGNNGQIIGILTFGTDFPAFEGHFPGQPVLPAVVQLAAVRFLAATHLGKQLVPTGIDRAKFKAMIGPEEQVSITIRLDQLDNDVTISFSIATDKGKAATGTISCQIMNG